jgi:hypothetical protein
VGDDELALGMGGSDQSIEGGLVMARNIGNDFDIIRSFADSLGDEFSSSSGLDTSSCLRMPIRANILLWLLPGDVAAVKALRTSVRPLRARRGSYVLRSFVMSNAIVIP